jgi:hypothetical protein
MSGESRVCNPDSNSAVRDTECLWVVPRAAQTPACHHANMQSEWKKNVRSLRPRLPTATSHITKAEQRQSFTQRGPHAPVKFLPAYLAKRLNKSTVQDYPPPPNTHVPILQYILLFAVAQFVETLCHKPEGRGFDSRWGSLISGRTVTQGYDSASNRHEYQCYVLWGKGGRCVRADLTASTCRMSATSWKVVGSIPDGVH